MFPSRFSQTLILASGFAIVWGMCIAWLATSFFPEPQTQTARMIYNEDGTLYLQDSTPGNLAKIKLWDEPETAWRVMKTGDPSRYPLDMTPLSTFRYPKPASWSPYVVGCRTPVSLNSSNRVDPGSIYYFIASGASTGTGYFAIVDLKSRLTKGYLGQRGMGPNIPPQLDHFDIPHSVVVDLKPWYVYASGNAGTAFHEESHYVYLNRPNSVLKIDVENGTVETLFDGPFLQTSYYQSQNSFDEERFYIRTNDKISTYIPASDSWGTNWLIPENLRDKNFSIMETQSQAMLFQWETKDIPQNQVIYQNTIVSEEGEIIETRNDVLRTQYYSSKVPPRRTRIILAAGFPSLIIIALPYLESYSPQYETFYEMSQPDAARMLFWSFTDCILIVISVTVICLILFIIRQYKAGVPILWWQYMFIVILGFPGFVALLWANPHKVRTGQMCVPKSTSIEIFA